MTEIITALSDFEEYAQPEQIQSYSAALQRYRNAYEKVFNLSPPFAPNLTAVKKLLEAAQEIADIEAGHAYRMGRTEGRRSAAG